VVVLHKGVLRAAGALSDLLAQTGAADVKSAFLALTAESAPGIAA
jgi:hypothetical protein